MERKAVASHSIKLSKLHIFFTNTLGGDGDYDRCGRDGAEYRNGRDDVGAFGLGIDFEESVCSGNVGDDTDEGADAALDVLF